jgi:AraC-like DNA-binding protein
MKYSIVDVIERKQILFPIEEGLPESAAFVHRGRRFFYAQDKGEQKGDSISVITEGAVLRRINGKMQKISAGSIYVSLGEDDVLQQACEGQAHKVILFTYHRKNERDLLRNACANKRYFPDPPPMARAVMETIYEELLNPAPCQTQLLAGYHQNLLIMISRLAGTCSTPQDIASDLYDLALHSIKCFPEETPTLYELSEKLGVSREHIIRTFKQKGAESPYQLLLKSRMERAMDWLEHTDWSVAEIAVKLGYNTTSAFIRSFKKLMGSTPKQTRISKDYRYK